MKSAKIHYTVEAAPLTPEEIAREFARFGRHDVFPRALTQILRQRLAAATLEAARPRMTEREAGHAGGRLEELISLNEELIGLMFPPKG